MVDVHSREEEILRNKENDILQLWPGEPHLLIYIILVQRERLAEHASKLADFALESGAVRPRECGVEHLARDALDSSGDLQVKRLKVLELRVLELARVDGVDDATGHRERAASASAVPAAGPASVDQPAVNFVLRHAFCEHLGVTTGLIKIRRPMSGNDELPNDNSRLTGRTMKGAE